jgi:lysophospholipase L1-like esterase
MNANSPERAPVHYVGRVLYGPDGAARFAWSGTSASVCVSGPVLSVDIEDAGQNVFALRVDGALRTPKLVPGPGRKTLVLADQLSPGPHVVTLVRLTEAMLGETCIHGFHAPGGELLAPPAPLARRIELIGDSISAGYGNEAAGPEHSFDAAEENHYRSYGALCARALDAELVTIAWSGKGVFSNCGSTEDTLTMPVLWRRTLPSEEHERWDVARFVPQALVLNLGTNDFSPANRDQAPFAREYLSFVRELRAAYPQAFILCTNGPLLSDSWPEGARTLSRAREGIEGAVETLRSEGDAHVDYLEFPQVTSREGHGADNHPSLVTHERMAAQLTEHLQRVLGW